VDLANATPVYEGTRSVAFWTTAGWAGFRLRSSTGVDTGPYATLRFALRATQPGQKIAVALYGADGTRLAEPVSLAGYGGHPEPGVWKLYSLPLAALNGQQRTITGVLFQDWTGQAQPDLYVDRISLGDGGALVQPTLGPTAPPTPTANCGGAPAYPELRPSNTVANQTPPRPADAANSPYPMPGGFEPYFAKIGGQGCVGTTEQILEWAAKKWGFDQLGYPDLAKAMAVKESWWDVSTVGDAGQSFGILQVKDGPVGYWPDGRYAATSTAFGADYAMAIVRFHYDGNSWLGAGTRGDLRNAVAAFFCGCGYDGAGPYATKVWEYLNARPWKAPGTAPYFF
jgi:hypothetical protein